MLNSDFICVNDGAPTRRNVTSVIDLFLIKPQFHRNVSFCVTLTHECVRSDHIPIMLELDDGIERMSEEEERYILKKTDWVKWKEVTQSSFQKWNRENHEHENMQELYNSFLEVWEDCMLECVPKRVIKLDNRKRTPHWMDEDVKAMKTELNRVKKVFRKRSNPNNLEQLKKSRDRVLSGV